LLSTTEERAKNPRNMTYFTLWKRFQLTKFKINRAFSIKKGWSKADHLQKLIKFQQCDILYILQAEYSILIGGSTILFKNGWICLVFSTNKLCISLLKKDLSLQRLELPFVLRWKEKTITLSSCSNSKVNISINYWDFVILLFRKYLLRDKC
jgi:hypothetical protein